MERKKCLALLFICTFVSGQQLMANGASEPVVQSVGDGEISFPLDNGIEIKIWGRYPANAATVMQDYGESEMYKELEKRTNVHVEFIHPTMGQEAQAFNLMVASKELPDLIEGDCSYYPGGQLKALEDGIIIDITELQKAYAPGLTKIYETYPDLLPEILTDDGRFLQVPFIRGHSMLTTYSGLAVRRDWLNELGLDIPETIDDWYNVLKAFKEKGVKTPYTNKLSRIKNPALAGAFGVQIGDKFDQDFTIKDGKVIYGPIDPAFRDYLATLAKWYAEGLIDPEFLVNDSKKVTAKVTNNEVGALWTLGNSGIGKYMGLMKEKNPEFDLVGVPYPVLKEGDVPLFMQRSDNIDKSGGVHITTANKYPVETMAWLDYGYTKDGYLLYNYGIEGVSYEMVDGVPTFTDLLMNNPDGIPFSSIAHKYVRSLYNGPYVQDNRTVEQYYEIPQQKESLANWTKYSKEVVEANLRVLGSLTPEELDKESGRSVEINTYKNEMFARFVMGLEPLSKFDAYVEQIKAMGIEESIQMRQNANDRFLAKYPQAANPQIVHVVDFYK